MISPTAIAIVSSRYAPALPPALASRINKAFDEAINGPSPAAGAAKKKSRKMVIPDDEEDDEEQPIASASASHDTAALVEPGGWIAEGDGAGQDYGGGGFLLDNDAAMASGGGGGFSPVDDGLGGGGGFLLDDNTPIDYTTAGGFLPDLDAPPAGGGFLLDDDMNGGGGFLPDLPELPPLPDLPSLDNDDLPAPQPPSRIPLKAIPAALDALSLPGDSHDLITLFREVASEDEDGVASVRREKFIEACSVLLGDEDDDSEDGKPTSDDDSEEEAYVEEGASKSRRRIPTRRSTRANPVKDDSVPAAMELDLADEDSEPYDSDDSDIEIIGPSSSKKGKGKAKATKGKAPARRKKARVLSKAEMQEAEDTFELFFEGGLQVGKTKDKVIGLAELERVTRVLNEKMTEDEMREMLEYATRDNPAGAGGAVDFTAFTKVLAEAL
ncbi:hypothetical protein BCR35DRAFT_330226 [Leucosporidium creatinivorum]|uniref:EF-hand domain-containing protein n=1 Tax=Leucosporidium creatinivorum TaxID=106004 RepID=A0A1Y2G0E9_9BASI|nr:hypothetical protein BCR35DRAFT_330226 [Leucosporidium creatinivorum]